MAHSCFYLSYSSSCTEEQSSSQLPTPYTTACPTFTDTKHYICSQEFRLCAHKQYSPVHFLAQTNTQTHPHVSDRKRGEVMTKIYCRMGRRRLHPEYARWGCTSELFSICYVQVNGNLLRKRKNNCKHLCLIHVYETKNLLESLPNQKARHLTNTTPNFVAL